MSLADLDADVVELAPCPEAPPFSPLREVAFRAAAWLPEEDDRLRTMFRADASIDEIASAIGRGRAGVADRICVLGLRRGTSRPWSELEDRHLVEAYGTVAAASIALYLGRSVTSVYNRAHLLDLTEDHPPLYTAWEDAQVRAGYAADVPAHQIAVLIGRTRSSVVSRGSALGLRHPSTPPNWTEEECGRLLGLANEGHQYPAIAAMMAAEGWSERSDVAVGRVLHRLGYYRGWGRRWTPEEDELLRRAYANGDSLTPLTERLGRSRTSLNWRCGEIGIEGSHPRPNGWRLGPNWTEAEEELLRAKFGKMPTKALAAQMGRKLASVYTRANLLGLNHPWMRAFTEDEDRAIAVAWKHGVGLRDLAEAMQRDPAVVHKRAKRIGLIFGDEARPARALRTPRADRRAPTLAGILAMGEPAPFGPMKYRRRVEQAEVQPLEEADPVPSKRHVPRRDGRPTRVAAVLARRIRPRAQRFAR